jgi:hypothetical protein
MAMRLCTERVDSRSVTSLENLTYRRTMTALRQTPRVEPDDDVKFRSFDPATAGTRSYTIVPSPCLG